MKTLEKIVMTEPVHVKMVVTEAFRSRCLDHIETQAAQLDQRMDELERAAQTEAGSAGKTTAVTAFRNQKIQAELTQLKEARKTLKERFEYFRDLPDGEEVPYKTFDSQIEISVGDDFFQSFGKEIVLKDGKVLAIRQLENPGLAV